MLFNQLEAGAFISFDTYSPSLLGARHTNVKVEGVVGFNIANQLSPGRDIIHADVYSVLPEGTPRDAKDLQFVVFYDNKVQERRAFALNWINESTLELASNRKITVRIEETNGVSDQAILENLQFLGVSGVSIS